MYRLAYRIIGLLHVFHLKSQFSEEPMDHIPWGLTVFLLILSGGSSPRILMPAKLHSLMYLITEVSLIASPKIALHVHFAPLTSLFVPLVYWHILIWLFIYCLFIYSPSRMRVLWEQVLFLLYSCPEHNSCSTNMCWVNENWRDHRVL